MLIIDQPLIALILMCFVLASPQPKTISLTMTRSDGQASLREVYEATRTGVGELAITRQVPGERARPWGNLTPTRTPDVYLLTLEEGGPLDIDLRPLRAGLTAKPPHDAGAFTFDRFTVEVAPPRGRAQRVEARDDRVRYRLLRRP